MISMLKRVWRKSRDAEREFKHKAILFIPTESFDAPTITVMQGLDKLGWTVYTIGKPNINSWFVNTIIDSPKSAKFDFVLSNLHWGNRWDHYDKYKLHDHFKVLIDGCDNRKAKHWEEKFAKYRERYVGQPSGEVMMKDLQPRRWTMPLGRYKPDVVFTSQKPFGSKAFYLPFGIHENYLRFASNKTRSERTIDFCNIPGPGSARVKLTNYLGRTRLPGVVHNKKVTGTTESSLGMFIDVALKDYNVNIHSWHRWLEHPDYFRVLNNTKVLICPNVYTDRPHWDSMRVWEAYASGCLCLLEKPSVDMAQYPVTELCEEALFSSHRELIEKAKWLYRNQGRLERFRVKAIRGALRYFAPVPLARYFLKKVGGAR